MVLSVSELQTGLALAHLFVGIVPVRVLLAGALLVDDALLEDVGLIDDVDLLEDDDLLEEDDDLLEDSLVVDDALPGYGALLEEEDDEV
jgi:hypothetical protein